MGTSWGGIVKGEQGKGGAYMMKATLQGAVLLGLLTWAVPGFAEVQNVRVGGDVTVRAFHRENLDLHDESGTGIGTGVTSEGLDRTDNFFMTTTGLNVGADLTENVSAFIRLANERDWNVDGVSTGDLDISQSYVTLKELFYSPLTLRVGAQPIVWGRGFVLGSNLIPGLIYGGNDRNAAITANEFTDFTAFDAVRATLDLSGVAGMPWTVDYVYIKIDENGTGQPDDVNLQGVNIGTKFDEMNTELEAYYLNKFDKNTGGITTGPTQVTDNDGAINTIGIRGSTKPVQGSYLYGELAYQFGQRTTDPSGLAVAGNDVQAWAADFGGEYTFEDVSFMPKLGAEWIFYSGKDADGAFPGWDPIARGYFTTVIREFQNPAPFNTPDQTCGVGGGGTAAVACVGSATNQHQLSLYGSVKPIEDLTLDQRLSWFFLPVGARPSSATNAGSVDKRKSYAGMEWDTILTYDYTSDVQFGVIYALFAPGNVYRDPNNSTAQELVTSVSVKF